MVAGILMTAPVMAMAAEEASLSTAVYTTSQRRSDELARVIKEIDSRFQSNVDKLQKSLLLWNEERLRDERAAMPLYPLVQSFLGERVFSLSATDQVALMLRNMRAAAISGHKEYSSLSSDNPTNSSNPASQPTKLAMDALILKKMEAMFCIPGSALATKNCKDSSAAPSRENYIDLFISNKTWPNATILDTMLLTRRFFSRAVVGVDLTQDNSEAGTFMGNQRLLAQDNLRLGILDSLIARRAPTSNATPVAMQALLTILAPSNTISSLNYEKVCTKPKLNKLEVYVCSFTSEPIQGGKRIISQAALDKIMQFDLVLSPMFFSAINSQAYTASGPIEKMEVFLKAQQVAQDYNQLRLLQKKTVATAMNMMNR